MATFPVKERFDNLYNYALGEEPPSAAPVTEVTNVRKKIDPVTGSIITGAIGTLGNLIMNYSNNRANDRRQQEAYEQNLRMWHMQNEYNSPASQIARLKAAGLNPNLIYGSPDNTAQSPPAKGVSEGKAGQVDPMLAMNAVQIASQIKLQDAQAKDLIASAALKEEQVNTEKSEQNYFESYSRFAESSANEKDEIVSEMQQMFDTKFDKLTEEVNLLRTENKAKFEEYRKAFNENEFFVRNWDLYKSRIEAQINKDTSEAKSFVALADELFSRAAGNRLANRLQEMLFEPSNNFALNGQRMSYYDLYIYTLGREAWRSEQKSSYSFGIWSNMGSKLEQSKTELDLKRTNLDKSGYGMFLYGLGNTMDALNLNFHVGPGFIAPSFMPNTGGYQRTTFGF